MSYLTLAAGLPNFSKAVISLWFRAPKASVVAASTHSVATQVPGFTILQNILPIVTFGQQQTSKIYRTPQKNVAVVHPYLPGEPAEGTRYDTAFYEEGESYNVDPSFVGLSCFSDGRFNVVFNIQMDNYMTLMATAHVTTRMDIWSGSDPDGPTGSPSTRGSGVVALPPNVGKAIIADASYVDNAQPEFFTVQTAQYFRPDQWHHLLLSFDVAGTVSVGTPFASSSCRLWYAIDDRDYRGAEHLGPYRDTGGRWGPDNLNPNAILTRNAWRFSGYDPDWEAIQYYQNQFVGLPFGNYHGGSIPTSSVALGIPADARYVDGIFRCEMAELQMWTGVTLDTGITSNRRAFVTADGQPVDPTEGTTDDPRGPAEKLLGKKPEILLHGDSEWASGHNTGTIGVLIDSEGNETDILSGQFKPTAKIEPWEPDPSLEEIPTA